MSILDINDAIGEDHLWQAYVGEAGVTGALDALNAIKSDLKLQRRQKMPADGIPQIEYRTWLKGQAGFEAIIDRRLRDARETLRVQGNPARDLRRKLTEAVRVIGQLALAIDGTELEYLLDEIKLPVKDGDKTLAEAIDEGVWA